MALLDGPFELPVKRTGYDHDHALLTLDLELDGSIVVKHLVEGCVACSEQQERLQAAKDRHPAYRAQRAAQAIAPGCALVLVKEI